MMMRPGGARPPLFRLFGIPVSVDLWMLLGLYLFYSMAGGGRSGLYAALAIGVFTLVHEMGHALTARAVGAQDVSIRLAFLVGWASYSGAHRLTRRQENLISLAGPLTEIVVGIAALAVVRASFPELGAMTREQYLLYYDLHWSIAFAGITIGALNLLPVWPLDGGHLAASFVARTAAAHRRFLAWSIGASGVMIVLGVVYGNRSGARDLAATWLGRSTIESFPLAIGHLLLAGPVFGATSLFIGLFTLLNSLSAWNAPTSRQVHRVEGTVDRRQLLDDSLQSTARIAERQGWSVGTPGPFPKGFGPSPWLDAELARRHGADTAAVAAQLAGLADDRRHWVVDRIERSEIAELLALVPPEAAVSDAVLEARVFHGPADELQSTAMELHRRTGSVEPYYRVAEGLSVRGDLDEAMNWLTAAVERAPDPVRIARSRQLRPLHGRTDFQQLLGVAERAVR